MLSAVTRCSLRRHSAQSTRDGFGKGQTERNVQRSSENIRARECTSVDDPLNSVRDRMSLHTIPRPASPRGRPEHMHLHGPVIRDRHAPECRSGVAAKDDRLRIRERYVL